MTLLELKTHTLERLDEDPTNPASWTVTEVVNALNEAQMFMALLTLCLETKVTLALSNASAFTTVLDQFADWILPLRVRQGGVKIRPVRLADLDALNPQWSSVPGAGMQRYGTIGFGLLFSFPPVTGTAEVVYANAPALLAADTDVPAIPLRAHPALISYATYRLREKQGGSEFQAGLAGLGEFLDEAKALGAEVRSRSLGQRYDSLPVELTRVDLSRLLKLRKDLLPEKAKEQPNAG